MQLTRLLIKKTFCLARYLDVIKLSQIYYYCYYTSYAVNIYDYVYFLQKDEIVMIITVKVKRENVEYSLNS